MKPRDSMGNTEIEREEIRLRLLKRNEERDKISGTYQQCPECHGSGTKICNLCKGTGWIGKYNSVVCYGCCGEKKIVCRFCNGKKYVPEWDPCNKWHEKD